MKHCQWCDNQFTTDIAHQVYCSAECREEATKEKIAERYEIIRRRRMFGKKRYCKSCSSLLSSYNDDSLCGSCYINPDEVMQELKVIKRFMNGKIKPD